MFVTGPRPLRGSRLPSGSRQRKPQSKNSSPRMTELACGRTGPEHLPWGICMRPIASRCATAPTLYPPPVPPAGPQQQHPAKPGSHPSRLPKPASDAATRREPSSVTFGGDSVKSKLASITAGVCAGPTGELATLCHVSNRETHPGSESRLGRATSATATAVVAASEYRPGWTIRAPGPTLVMLAAIVSGVTAVIFGFGLSTSLNRIQADLSHAAAEQVQVLLGGRQGQSLINGKSAAPASLAAQEHAVQDALHAQPGTPHSHGGQRADQPARAIGPAVPGRSASAANASWTGYAMIAGHWYDGPGQVDVNTAFLTATGAHGRTSSTRSPPAASTSRCRSPARSSIPRAGSRR